MLVQACTELVPSGYGLRPLSLRIQRGIPAIAHPVGRIRPSIIDAVSKARPVLPATTSLSRRRLARLRPLTRAPLFHP
jgi:hypothetical protein